ncbi:S8 family serine peptidase [bacterium]|nr:S8 family serine peptidase [bacterium]
MRKHTTRPGGLRTALALLLPLSLAAAVTAAAEPRARTVPGTDTAALQTQAVRYAAEADARRTPRWRELRARTDGPQGALNRDLTIELLGIDAHGRPWFAGTTNLIAAQTVSLDHVWPGGSSGFDQDGANVAGELALWDAGAVMTSHQEFGGRVAIADGSPDVHYHANHVAGILVAAGVDPNAKGMSFAAYLDSYDWSDDELEMAAGGASGLLISNHSYGWVTGWQWSSTAEAWYWYGDVDVSTVEDPGFGFYAGGTQWWDEIAHDAPTYLIVKSAGNDRNDYGPDDANPGHWYWNAGLEDWDWSTDLREYDGEATYGYDTLPYRGNAKNVLTVGAVHDVPGGWTQPSDVVMSTFSGYGPTDDGRIKPDIVANGIDLYSTYVDSDTSYASFSGTSMSGPNAAGAIHVLAQQYRGNHPGQTALSSTLKALVIHTANEAGDNVGPDYKHGWGLLNALSAAEIIDADADFAQRITETALAQGERDTLILWSGGVDPVVATLCWNDSPGTPPAWSVDPTDLMLVNDLDLRVERVSDAFAYEPWILNPVGYTVAASTGDNFRDNVEKIETGTPQSGYHRVIVSHKGTLTDGPQAYSLVLSGLGAAPQPPVVSNVAFSQRTDGSGIVDIAYDLADPDSPSVTVSLQASADGGGTWGLTTSTRFGDVGEGIATGNGKSIQWNFAADHPGQFFGEAMIRITAADAPLIVVLGSSTAAGAGASYDEISWAGLYASYLRIEYPEAVVINLAEAGYTTYHILPTGHDTPPDRPTLDPTRNITKALSYEPWSIIVNLPSNDVTYGYSIAEQMTNYATVAARAAAEGVQIWFSTAQPRNLPTQAARDQLFAQTDTTLAVYGDHALDFWSGLGDPTGMILPFYDSGDGIHPNNEGHRVLFSRVVDAEIW